MQLATALSVENRPDTHAMQEAAPADVPELVRDPAGQVLHPVTFETAVNSPAGQAWHVVAPPDTDPV